MRVINRERQEEIILQTVSLSINPSKPDHIYMFRCYKCGTSIQKVVGEISVISAGLIPTSEVTSISQCARCKKNYTFQTVSFISEITKLTLTHEDEKQTFHCVICRMQLIQYTLNNAKLLPQSVSVSLPTGFTCFNPTCSKKYILSEITSTLF